MKDPGPSKAASIGRSNRFRLQEPLLSQPRGLSLQLPQIIKLSPSDLRALHHFDLVNHRRMQGKYSLHTSSERHLANCES